MAFSLVCSANYNQAADCLPIKARGRQCVPCSLMFLITAHYIKPCPHMETEDLHDILYAGSDLYCALDQSDSHTGLLDPESLPERITYKGHSIYIKRKEMLSGVFGESVHIDGNIYLSLEHAFTSSCVGLSASAKSFILVFNGVSIGIHYDGNLFFIFDSHSRDENGLSDANGTCLLGCVQSLDGLCCYLNSLLESLSPNPCHVQFDLHSFVFTKMYFHAPFVVEILDNRQGFNIKKVVKRGREPKSPDLQRKRQHFLEPISDKPFSISGQELHRNEESRASGSKSHEPVEGLQIVATTSQSRQIVNDLMKGKSFTNFIDDRHVTVPVPLEESKLVSQFNKLVSIGPDYVCSCCTQTFFKHYMKKVQDLPRGKFPSHCQYLSKYKSVDNLEWVCSSCWECIRNGKTPQFWVNNGLQFPNKPKELELSNLEERLVSPRQPFMQLREMPRGGQVSIKGNVVNVPADVNGTIKSLPRMINDDETIMLKLKRRLSYKHHVAFENIRPNKVFDAAKWLVSNSTLFKNEGIVINETWLQHIQETQNNQDEMHATVNCDDEVTTDKSSDDWAEDENFDERLTGNQDTCLQSIDFREFNQVLSVAPGEKNSPISLFQDFHSEALSFPTISCGQSRTDNANRQVPLHYSAVCKWELRNVDRRVALCVPNIFFKLKRLQIKQIKDKVSLAIRKCKAKGQTFTAGELLNPSFVDKLTMQDDGYRVLRTLRGSPPYWEQAKRDVFAMIRQLGIPTWFCSFSAAETKWEPLLRSLSKLVNGKDLSSEEIQNLSWQDKCMLIKSDPVTCARYFDQRVQTFIKSVLKHKSKPVGEIVDFFYRVEFQQRGSPHIHMLVWIKGAPIHGVSADASIASFVDKYVTCAKDETIPTLINYQTHRHARTCKKGDRNVCRFNFPLFPLPQTVILHPLEKEHRKPVHVERFDHVTSFLNDLHKSDSDGDIQFEDFLESLEMDYDTYVETIRSTLTRSKVFLKRSVCEVRINNYNSVLIKCWQANMDIQFVLDAYSCVSYIVSYISKGQRGLSNLLRDACSEARESDSDIRQQVRRIGNQFLSSVEIGAQEAVYLVLQMPLRRCTREVIYVDNKRPDERTSLIKPFSELKKMSENAKNIEMDNALKRYKRRPKCIEHLCYADFVSWYELCKTKQRTPQTASVDNCHEEELPETEYDLDKEDDLTEEDVTTQGKIIRFACGTAVRKRQRQKVIYSHITPIGHDREEHFREKIMLYTHWRDEEKDLIEGFETFEESFNAQACEICGNKSKYEKNDVDEYEHLLDSIDEHTNSVVHREAQHQELLDADEGTSRTSTFGCFDPGVSEHEHEGYDLGEDLGIRRRQVGDGILPHNELENDDYLQSIRKLNIEQKKFFYHILHKIKMNSAAFYSFLTGGAGVGKSVVIKCLFQAMVKYFNHRREEDPNTVKILLCAPTGKAAHNIGGNTIHSAFCIPANQGFHFKPLDMQQLNTMRARYHDLKVVIIDEISMVGRSMLNYINLRLKEIMGCTNPFGNISILAVGDLFQLKPVMDSWVFSGVFSTADLHSIATNLWVDLFDFFELKEIMRQKDDHAFALLLNRLREGQHTEEDLEILQRRQVKNPSITSENKLLPHLFCKRNDAALHNASVLSDMPSTDIINIEAIDDVSGIVSSSVRDQILTKIPLDSSKTMGLQTNLQLGLGLPAELCLNVNTSDGLTNGASCYIKKFDFRVNSSSRCSIVWVEFEDESIGKKWRTQYRHLYQEGISLSWTPILETCRKFTLQYYKTYLIVRRQFPIYLSSGKTIHKAQGSTIKEAVMHFGARKIDHIHYVGLSRVTSLSGVHILELNSAKISVSPEVAAEMDRLRTEKLIQESLPDLRSFEKESLKVCFQNCRSLRKHIDDIKQEHNLLLADIIGLVETRLSGPLGSEYEMDGFTVLNSHSEQSIHGITVYHKHAITVHHVVTKTVFGIEYTLAGIGDGVVIGFVYCPPKTATVSNLTNFLLSVAEDVSPLMLDYSKQAKLILMGDFNFGSGKQCFAQLFMDILGLNQILDSVTTDHGSCIDHIYINFCQDQLKCFGTLESYYSDHKPLFLAIHS